MSHFQKFRTIIVIFSEICFFELKIDVFEPKSVGILEKKYLPLNTSELTPVTWLGRSETFRKYENSIFIFCDILPFFVHISDLPSYPGIAYSVDSLCLQGAKRPRMHRNP